MKTAKNEPEIAKAATCAPVNDGLRKKLSGSIGSEERRSAITKATSRAAAAASSATIRVEPQPSSLPRSSARTSRNSPPVSVICPGQSSRRARGSRDSCTHVRAIHSTNAPSGRFTRKIDCQPSPLVRAPPTAGPTAKEAPIVAP
jgi:hypothetical protein